MDPRIEELANDPIMGRAFRELGLALAEKTNDPSPPPRGQGDYAGQPTDGSLARAITQDRPSDLVPSYSLPGRTAGEPLAWHREACDLAAGRPANDGAGPEQQTATRAATETAAPTPFPIHPSLSHLNPQVGMVVTPIIEHAEQLANSRRGEPTPTIQSPPVQDGPSVKPAGIQAAVATPEFAKIKATVAEVFKEARDATGSNGQQGGPEQAQPSRGAEGRGR